MITILSSSPRVETKCMFPECFMITQIQLFIGSCVDIIILLLSRCAQKPLQVLVERIHYLGGGFLVQISNVSGEAFNKVCSSEYLTID